MTTGTEISCSILVTVVAVFTIEVSSGIPTTTYFFGMPQTIPQIPQALEFNWRSKARNNDYQFKMVAKKARSRPTCICNLHLTYS